MRESTTEYAQLVGLTGNIGDEFQSLAAIQHLPEEPRHFVEREAINAWPAAKPVTMIMNGWFSRNPEAWPPPPSIRPIFVGFHVTEKFRPTVEKHAGYLRQFEPIGARDDDTRDFLRSIGVKAETTYCLTLTFPQRQRPPANGKVFIADADDIEIPRALRRNAVKVRHIVTPVNRDALLPFARAMIEFYRDEARLVITTRLHAALPCIAMGIPVVFFGNPNGKRTAIIRDIGGKIYSARLHRRGLLGRTVGAIQQIDWSPQPIDISPIRERLALAVATRLRMSER